jgi:hypothetical protein
MNLNCNTNIVKVMDVYSCNKEFYCYCLLLMLQLTVYSKNKIYLITLDTSLKEKFKFFFIHSTHSGLRGQSTNGQFQSCFHKTQQHHAGILLAYRIKTVIIGVCLKGPKHDQVGYEFFYIKQTRIVR